MDVAELLRRIFEVDPLECPHCVASLTVDQRGTYLFVAEAQGQGEARTKGSDSVQRLPLAILATLAIMYLVPFPIYGGLSMVTDIEPPSPDSPGLFMLSVLVVKVGVAIGFVLLFYLGRSHWLEDWKTYAGVWWAMFAIMEVGQAIVPDYTWLDAFGGIIAEAIYFPVSAVVVARLIRPLGGSDASA